jgi:preprotein translocase subunit SecE
MSLLESIVIVLGFIILLVGSFVGRDFSNRAEVFEGFIMIILFVVFFSVVFYLDSQTFGDKEPHLK